MSSSSDENEDIPDVATCQRLTEEFASITGTDTACAQFYLQDREWSLEKSVNDFFEDRKGKGSVRIMDDENRAEVVLVVDGSAQSLAAAASAILVESMTCNPPAARITRVKEDPDKSSKSAESCEDTKHPIKAAARENLKFITWNIDGLNHKNLRLRTKAVCQIILDEDVDVAFLQEVVPETLSVIEDCLEGYKVIVEDDTNYFTATLLRESTVAYEAHKYGLFPSSVMERGLTIVDVQIGEVPVTLLNTHLESTEDFSKARKTQLRRCFKEALKVASDRSVILAGDLNLRDQELEECGGVPPCMEDMWLSCGGRKECSYTWDMTRNDNLVWNGRFKPKCRFDRVYLKFSDPVRMIPKNFGLIGLERLRPHTCFPSDHWGVLCHFDLKQTT